MLSFKNMELSPESAFRDIRAKITPEMKLAFISTMIIGILCHFPYLSSNYLNEDTVTMQVFSDRFGGYCSQGRWAASLVSNRITSSYLIQSVIGFFAILWFAMFSAGIVNISKIRKKINIVIVSALIIAFPTISYASGYINFFDTLCASIFMGMASVFIVVNIKGIKGILCGAFALMFSMAIYQQSLGTAMMTCIIIMICNIFESKKSNQELLKDIVRFILFGILGCVLYFISIRISNIFIPISSYKGLNEMGSIGISEIPMLILKAYKSFFAFFLGEKFFYASKTLIICYLISIVLFGTFIISLIIKDKIYKNIFVLSITILLILMIPISVNIIDIASPESGSYNLTVYNMVLVFILYIKIIEINLNKTEKENNVSINFVRGIALLSSIIVIFNYIIIDNIYYLKAKTYTERSYALSNRILTRMEQIDGFKSDMKVIVLGSLPNYNYPGIKEQFPEIQGDVGLRNIFIGYPQTTSFLNNTKKFLSTMNQYYGMNFEYPEEKDIVEIENSEEYYSMKSWPDKESVKIIDNTIVINLKFSVKAVGNIDIDTKKLHFEVFNDEIFPAGSKYSFKIYKNYSNLIETTKYSENNYIDLNINEEGVYHVRVYIKDKDGNVIETSVLSNYVELK